MRLLFREDAEVLITKDTCCFSGECRQFKNTMHAGDVIEVLRIEESKDTLKAYLPGRMADSLHPDFAVIPMRAVEIMGT